MKEPDIIQLINQQLDIGAERISPNVSKKLVKIRENAVKNAFKSKNPHWFGSSALTLGHFHFSQRTMALVSTLLLISVITIYGAWVNERNENDQGMMDARMLSSDLPVQAFATQEISQWLEN